MGNQHLHWADIRKVFENNEFRVLSSLLSVGDASTEKGVLDFLDELKDTTIAPNRSVKLLVSQDLVTMIIPLVGVLEISDHNEALFLEPSKYCIKSMRANEVFEIRNPYETEHVNFIQLNLSKDIFAGNLELVFGEFNLDENLNNVVMLGQETIRNSKVYMGKFGCKKEGFLTNKESFNAYFFVINGSFEVNGMMLHQRDSASFAQISTLDYESLSEESMLLVLINK